ncbi:MAG: tetratricopeptide repeat protein [Elusimicrobia bacterium]|nr:tetratricopeptide repeat protein [Elusimicrobiota bacterium]
MYKKTIIYLVVLIIIPISVYFNSSFNKFAFDDIHIVEKNPLIKNTKNIFLLFRKEYGAETAHKDSKLYRPFIMVTYLVTYTIFGSEPLWHHLGNVLLHTVNVLIVFFLCKQMLIIFSKKAEVDTSAFLCGLFFAVHPVLVESVAGIVGRAELMTGFFCLAAFLLYLRGRFYSSMTFFFCGLLSKETAISLFPLIILYELFFNKRLSRIIPGYFAVILLYIPIRFLALDGLISGEKIFYFKEGILTRIFTMGKVMVYYMKLMFIPYPLNPDWGVSGVILKSDSIIDPYVLISLLIILGIFFLAWFLLKSNPIVTFSLLWFFVFLLPVSNIIPIGDLMAERFLYLPTFGFCLFAGAMIPKYKILKRAAPVILLLFVFITIKQNTIWKNNTSLWKYVTEKFPKNWRAYWELGKCYRAEENYAETTRLFEKSLAIRETDLVLFDYGNILRRQNNTVEALKVFDKYIVINRNNPKVYLERAKCFNDIRNYEKAKDNFETAMLLSPEDDNVIYETGRFYLLRSNWRVAKEYFEKAISINKNNAGVLVGLGVYYFKMGEFNKAKGYFSNAQRIEPDNMEAAYNLVVVNMELGEKEEAKQLFEKFKQLFPNDKKIKQMEDKIYEKV